MDEQRSESFHNIQGGLDPEYHYIVHIKAMETFTNFMRREGIVIPEGMAHVSFTSSARLNMKGYKEMGMIWSYSIIRVRKDEDVIEEG